jgi:hypothetical protein
MNKTGRMKFSSLMKLFGSFFRMFSGPTFFMTFRKTGPVLREKLLLTVSMSNECGG